MTTTMPSPPFSQAYCELIQPYWEGNDRVNEEEHMRAVRQGYSLYTTNQPAPPVDIPRSASPLARTRPGVEAGYSADVPDAQPLQCSPPPAETAKFDQHAQCLQSQGRVPASAMALRSRRNGPSTHVRSRSSPQTSYNQDRLQPLDDQLPNETNQVNRLL
ncbi:hypothetical protein NA56DRAFT_663303 [Hyaloscypha hepaticicola]|uniref:Uncharacterized protein n=1 Tax=Hyaloscypha hepaticicola TaxID=2082293 RepID=A0A2J6PPV1_9HELO|nr:hypothetical protein NA56DRAFT_663303 [Hyaloscypha hepaticicola]